MKQIKKLLALALCLVLCLSLSVTAFATTPPTGSATSGFTTTMTIDTNVTAPNVTFTYSFAGGTVDSSKGEYAVATAVTKSFTAADLVKDTTDTSKRSKSLTVSDVFGADTATLKANGITNAGVWVFDVTEAITWVQKTGFTLDSTDTTKGVKTATSGDITETWTDTLTVTDHSTAATKYTLRLYVENEGTNGLKIATITVADASGTKIEIANFKFDSKYTEDYEKKDDGGGDDVGKTGALTVTKVIGKNRTKAKLDKPFPIIITVNKSQTTEDTTVAGMIYHAATPTAAAYTEDVTVTYGATTTYQLSDGDIFSIQKLPVGASFTVSEGTDYTSGEGKEGYKLNGISPASGTYETNPTSQASVVTNDYNNDTPPTGIEVNNLPFAVIVALALTGILVFFAYNRRKAED